jgi:hypothetical protein
MQDKKNECPNFKGFIDTKDQFKVKCSKHYCLCDDEFKWCNETNEKYQLEKTRNKAALGKFFK